MARRRIVPTARGCALFHCGQLETRAWLDAAKPDGLHESLPFLIRFIPPMIIDAVKLSGALAERDAIFASGLKKTCLPVFRCVFGEAGKFIREPIESV